MLGSEIRDYISDEAYYMLELAVARQQLNLNEVMRISQKFKFDIMPVKESGKSSIFEYAFDFICKDVPQRVWRFYEGDISSADGYI